MKSRPMVTVMWSVANIAPCVSLGLGRINSSIAHPFDPTDKPASLEQTIHLAQ